MKDQGDSPNVTFYASISPFFEKWLVDEKEMGPGTPDEEGKLHPDHCHWKFPC